MRMVATQKFKKEKTLTTTKKIFTQSYFSCVYVGFSSNKRQRIKKLFYFDFVSLYKCKQHFFSSKTQHKGKTNYPLPFFYGESVYHIDNKCTKTHDPQVSLSSID